MLKVSPWKGVVRFGKRGKLNPRYVGPSWWVIESSRNGCYKLKLPPTIKDGVHNTFHGVFKSEDVFVDESLCILLEEYVLRQTPFCGVQWKLWIVKSNIEGVAIPSLKCEDQFKQKYPHLFTKNAPSSSAAS
ncbi:hypothetical protein Tco_1163786 [Tanacetum coccineum]